MKQKGLNLSRSVRQNIVLLALILVEMVLFTIMNGRFLTLYNLMNIVRQNVPNVIIAGAMALVIISGAIDLSVGGVMALSAVVYGKLCVWGVNSWLAIVPVLVLGVFIGWVNKFISETLGIPAIMATLATWLASAGLALTLCQAIPISDPEVKPITVLNATKLFGGKIPLALFISVFFVAVFLFLEKRTLLGKYAVSIGGNANAAIFSGINVRRMRLIYFSMCSVMACLAGIWQVARLGSADPKIGTGMEFSVLSACILGGVNIKGGEGSVLGAVIGVYLLAILTNGMQMMNIDDFYQQVVIGIVLLGAVLINQLGSMYTARKALLTVGKKAAGNA